MLEDVTLWLLAGILVTLLWIGATLQDIRRHMLMVLYDSEGYLKAQYRED